MRLYNKDYYIGDETMTKQDVLKLSHPIEHGYIIDWENISRLWHYTFSSKLREIYEGSSIIMTEPPLNPKANREKLTQIMFEQFITFSVFT